MFKLQKIKLIETLPQYYISLIQHYYKAEHDDHHASVSGFEPICEIDIKDDPLDQDNEYVLNSDANHPKKPAKKSVKVKAPKSVLSPRPENNDVLLWQFLLELLQNPAENCDYICWVVKSEGQFRLKDPEAVAQLWGQRKNKTNMNYDKLSRALRYEMLFWHMIYLFNFIVCFT